MPFLLEAVLVAGLGTGAPVGASLPGPVAVAADTVPSFQHSQHESLECTACHRMDAEHGGTLVRSVQDCRSCHHTERTRMDCAACHPGAELREETFVLPRAFDLTVGQGPTERELTFLHGDHEELECASCHDDGPSLAVPELDCGSCHEEHHEVTTACFTCHVEPAGEDHDRTVHLTCSSAGCHQEVPVEGTPRSRAGCLWCHQDETDHRPGRECVACHLMPDPVAGDGGGGNR